MTEEELADALIRMGCLALAVWRLNSLDRPGTQAVALAAGYLKFIKGEE